MQQLPPFFVRPETQDYDPSLPLALVVTKPPETVLVVRPPGGEGQWQLFDSHSRPQLGMDGAHWLGAASVGALQAHLHTIFPTVNFDDDGDGGGMMGAMYNMVEATPLQLPRRE